MAERGQSHRRVRAAKATFLVINRGSSSVKFALFAANEPLLRLWSGAVERIGLANGRFRTVGAKCPRLIDRFGDMAAHPEAAGLSRSDFATGGQFPQSARHLRPIHGTLPYCIHGSSHEHA